MHTDTYFGNSYISGIQFFDKGNDVILSAGIIGSAHHDAVLEVGERLIGIRSTLYSNDSRNGTIHCNMTLVVGKLE